MKILDFRLIIICLLFLFLNCSEDSPICKLNIDKIDFTFGLDYEHPDKYLISGEQSDLSIENLEEIKQREDYWAVEFWGKIHIPEDDKYQFALSSDDGSRLFIDGKEIINNDGIHGNMEIQGTTFLTAGKHDIRIEFFEGNYGELLKLHFSCNDMGRQSVPLSMLYFE